MPAATAGGATTPSTCVRPAADGRGRRRAARSARGRSRDERGARGRVTRTCRAGPSRRPTRRPPRAGPRAPLPSSWSCTATWLCVCHAAGRVAEAAGSSVPDVLAPGPALRLLRHQPGPRVGGRGGALREPAQRLLAALARRRASPRACFEPSEQFALLELGYGVTNAAYRTTPGLGRSPPRRLRPRRLERLARELRPRAIAFVGKEAYRGLVRRTARARPAAAGRSARPRSSSCPRPPPRTRPSPTLSGCAGSRAAAWLEPTPREAVRALVVDARGTGAPAPLREPRQPGGVVGDPRRRPRGDENDDEALRRELREECGLAYEEAGRSSGSASTSTRGRASSTASGSASTCSASRRTSSRPRSSSRPSTSTATAGGRSRSSRRPPSGSPRARSRPACGRSCATGHRPSRSSVTVSLGRDGGRCRDRAPARRRRLARRLDRARLRRACRRSGCSTASRAAAR